MEHLPCGKHVIIDLTKLEGDNYRKLLNDPERLDTIFRAAIVESGATCIGQLFHKFEPEGVSGIYLLSESHLAYHTYPSPLPWISIDLFTCGLKCDPSKAADYILEQFRLTAADTDKQKILLLERGYKQEDLEEKAITEKRPSIFEKEKIAVSEIS